jgi:hypothetical protein
MSVVLLEQLIKKFNETSETVIEVYSGVRKDRQVEIGLAERFKNKPLININFKQTPIVSHDEGLDQGATRIIDALFGNGLSYLINFIEKEDEKSEEGSGKLCEDNK